jgi:tetratricopeptide (TPR) repeat protein
VFLPALQNQFVDWDDDVTLVDNPEFRGLRWTNLRWMFTTTLMGHWIPLTWITFAVDYLVWGMNPLGYHLTSLLLHAAAAVAFYLVALRLLRASMAPGEGALRLGALAAALCFAIHPLRVESVAWVTERRDVLSGLWLLLTILTYLVAAEAPDARRRRWLIASVACYALAAASKAIVMTLPVVLLLLDFYPLRRLGPRWREWTAAPARAVWVEKIPYLLLALGTAGMAVYAQRSLAESLATQPLESRIAVALYGLGFYVWKTVIPYPIAPLYQIPFPVDPAAPEMLWSALAVGVLTAAFLWLRRRWPAGLAVWISYVVLLAPVSGLTQSGPQLVAARYSYLACLGWALLVGAAVCLLARQAAGGLGWAHLGAAAVVAGFVVLGALSWWQARVWHDSEALWSYAVALEPDAALGRNNLGFAYLNQGRLDEAEREILIALRLRPEWELAQTNLAAILVRQGRYEKAGEARAQLGYLYLKHKNYKAAVDLFQKEVNVRPGDAAAHNNLGAALFLQGDVAGAIEHFERALQLDPGHDKARRNLEKARQAR